MNLKGVNLKCTSIEMSTKLYAKPSGSLREPPQLAHEDGTKVSS